MTSAPSRSSGSAAVRFGMPNSTGDRQIPRPRSDTAAAIRRHSRVRRGQGRNTGRLPGHARLHGFDHVMSKNHVRFERDEAGIGHAGMLILIPLVQDARHPRQRSTHPAGPLQAAHDDSVAVIVERADRHSSIAPKNVTAMALSSSRLERFLRRQGCCCFSRSPDHRFRRRPSVLPRKIPEAVAGMANDGCPVARAQADPRAAADGYSASSVCGGRGSVPLAIYSCIAMRARLGRVKSLRRLGLAPADVRKNLGRIAVGFGSFSM